METAMVAGKHRLTVKKVKNAKKWGYLSDGAGLYLKVRKGGSKTWAYIWTKNGKRNELSLGSASGAQESSLAQARAQADIIRKQIGEGLDPIAERNREAPKTFLDVSTALLSELLPTWENKKTAQQWKRSLLKECEPIHGKPIDSLSDADCRKVVMPVWKRTPESGRRLRKRMERVFSYAEAHGMREGRNPARWEGHFKEAMVGSDKIKRKHFPAMPYAEIPAFINQLQEIGSVTAHALEFTILTGARSGEALGAVWSEIDLGQRAMVNPCKADEKRPPPRGPAGP